MDFSPFIISLKAACCATLLTFFLGLLAAWLITPMKRGKSLLDGLFSLPMVLPPTVVGFFLLLLFGNNSLLGKFLDALGMGVIFTWQGAAVASMVVSFPIMYRTARGALEQVDENLIHAARTLGMNEFQILLRVMLPASWPGIMAGTILAFARALGEFGATIMLAGNIPGKTQTMSVAIYTAVQSGNRALAYRWTAVIMAMSFVTILLMNYLTDHRKSKRRSG
ncbi:MAG TPA: molybdate ABC transporter permease subunit [Candidatus Acetatifactor stercoripullorum]|uniref:Molybdenum transport system permease n=1 Tax=Candidatus Acetatifactor stercoripullorum TaxID=2838414 RepID=A0A9D1R5Y4_9FIRM|nr:molybdate ABC transporter permease subunit [uncultured Acetatifactor sp.]HIW81470.1 molybdate ABC transporter permease subunit [Candidatus Acetatifactor stercoripullorum]